MPKIITYLKGFIEVPNCAWANGGSPSHVCGPSQRKASQQGSKAQKIHVFVRTDSFRMDEAQYENGATFRFASPTSDTALIIQAGHNLLELLYRWGYCYRKCGIVLLDLVPAEPKQGRFFGHQGEARQDRLMAAIDKINLAMGRGTVFYAAQGIKRALRTRCANRSPSYTTKWAELPSVF